MTLVMVRIARREQLSATRTRPTPRSKSSVANELDVDVVNSGRSATLLTRSSKVLLFIRSLRQSSCWVRSIYIYITIRLTVLSVSILVLFCSVLFFYIYRHGRRVAQVVQRQRQQNACVGVAERVPFGTSRFHCDSRRRIQLEQGNMGIFVCKHID